MENKKYKVIKQFDSFYCDVGRITVNPGALFKITNGRVYFLNTQNYLPWVATKLFLSMTNIYAEN
ncbi:Uncharacterised protein [[Eubacterium] contortum]|uniref:Uncharacterized protein n=1 Tax=Faecalicatena contorta TaxID=39482 RepID=A0A174NF76_9FIRM|nr:Uncharacterised protein [[Eubacterium] contortum] [Faecalicatena contorta]